MQVLTQLHNFKMNSNSISLRQATNYMARLQSQGYDCWFKTVSNKKSNTREETKK